MNVAGLGLILFAILLFVAEIKVVSHGLLSLGGAIALIAGSLLLFSRKGDAAGYRVDLGIIVPGLALTLAIVGLLTWKTLQLRRTPVRTGLHAMIGETARVAREFGPDGSGHGAPARRVLERGRPGGPSGRGAGAGRPDRGRNPVRRTEERMRELFNVPGILVAGFIGLLFLFKWINVLNEYERAVTFWLGRLGKRPKGPGLVLIFWPFERMVRMSLRTVVHDVPPQDIITKDNVSVKVNAVVYFRVVEPEKAVVQVENYLYATSQLAQTTLRSVLGQALMDELLSEREKLNVDLQKIIDEHTQPWGIKVSLVEVKQVDLPPEMQRAMAKQAEAEREKRAKIIHAQGELEAAAALSKAAEIIDKQPATLQLRYLQTLTEIANEKNSTIVFPLPIDLIKMFVDRSKS